MKNKNLFFRKTARLLVLLAIGFMFIQCGEDEEYYTHVYFNVQNYTQDTIEVRFSYRENKEVRFLHQDNVSDFLQLQMTQAIHPGDGSLIRGFYYSATSSKDHFNGQDALHYIFAQDLSDKNLTVMTLSGKMIANWNDTSALLFDEKYWTKIVGLQPYQTTYTYILNLTDEVLERK